MGDARVGSRNEYRSVAWRKTRWQVCKATSTRPKTTTSDQSGRTSLGRKTQSVRCHRKSGHCLLVQNIQGTSAPQEASHDWGKSQIRPKFDTPVARAERRGRDNCTRYTSWYASARVFLNT